MKFFKKFALMLTSIVVISVFSILITEYMGLKQAQLDMACYMNLAAEYAMSTVQDNTKVVNSGFSDDFSDTTQYKDNEYKQYLKALAGYSGSENYLGFAYDTMNTAYESAKIKSGSLDENLEYKPLSFNLPYISITQVTQEYEKALEKIIANNGGASGSRIVLADFTGDSLVASCQEYITQKGLTDYLTGSGVDLSNVNEGLITCVPESSDTSIGFYKNSLVVSDLSIKNLDETLIRKLYGDASKFDDILDRLASSLNTIKYKDIRFSLSDYTSSGASNTSIPYYSLTFYTDWLYVTQNSFLVIPFKGATADNKYYNLTDNGTYASENNEGRGLGWNDNSDGNAQYVDDVNSNNLILGGVRAYIDPDSHEGAKTPGILYLDDIESGETAIRDGQLMLNIVATNNNILDKVQKEYTIIG